MSSGVYRAYLRRMQPLTSAITALAARWIAVPLALALLGRLIDSRLDWGMIPPGTRAALIVVGMAGALLACWGELQLRMLGIRPVEEEGDDAGGGERASGAGGLHLNGPYRLTRHPVYWGLTAYFIGWTAAFGSTAGTVILVPAVTVLWILFAILFEEPALQRQYGPAAELLLEQTPFFPDPRRVRAATNPPSIPPLYLFLRGFLRPFLKVWTGLEHPPAGSIPAEGPLVVAANHRSYLDPFLLAAAFPRPISFMTTAEAFRLSRQRPFLRGIGCIKLRRYTPDAVAIRKVLRTLEAGGVVGVFPEGERSWDGGPSPILPGVCRMLVLARAPVLAVDLSGSYRIWPRWGRGPRRSPVRIRWTESSIPNREREVELWLVDSLASHPSSPSQRNKSAADVGRLIWRCPSCGKANAVRGLSDGRVYCVNCDMDGRLHDGSHLSFGGEGPYPLREWARRVALSGEERRALSPPGPDPFRRWSFLRLSDGEGDEPLTRRGKGEAILTPKALVLRARGWRAYIPAQTVRSLTVEGSHKLQVATPGRIYELRYRRGSPRGPRIHLEAWLDTRGIVYRRG